MIRFHYFCLAKSSINFMDLGTVFSNYGVSLCAVMFVCVYIYICLSILNPFSSQPHSLASFKTVFVRMHLKSIVFTHVLFLLFNYFSPHGSLSHFMFEKE